MGVSMWLSYLIGGHWYVTYYAGDKAIILAGDWPWAHKFFMEAKEHLFFILLMAATYLPIALRSKLLLTDQNYRRMVIALTAVVVAIGLTMEGMGAITATGVRVGLMG
jgi:predicted membrane channel-forming protein YqfA (hemolysin III family)